MLEQSESHAFINNAPKEDRIQVKFEQLFESLPLPLRAEEALSKLRHDSARLMILKTSDPTLNMSTYSIEDSPVGFECLKYNLSDNNELLSQNNYRLPDYLEEDEIVSYTFSKTGPTTSKNKHPSHSNTIRSPPYKVKKESCHTEINNVSNVSTESINVIDASRGYSPYTSVDSLSVSKNRSFISLEESASNQYDAAEAFYFNADSSSPLRKLSPIELPVTPIRRKTPTINPNSELKRLQIFGKLILHKGSRRR